MPSPYEQFERAFVRRVWLLVLLLVALIILIVTASTRASLPPTPAESGTIYWADPCVRALLGAMEAMEPFIVSHYIKEDTNRWRFLSIYASDDGMDDYIEAKQLWDATKRHCWRE